MPRLRLVGWRQTLCQPACAHYIEPNKQTVAQFPDEWIAFIKPSVAPKTLERYAELCRKSIVPLIGDVTLAKLKTDRTDAAFSKALQSGRRDGTGWLSPHTVIICAEC